MAADKFSVTKATGFCRSCRKNPAGFDKGGLSRITSFWSFRAVCAFHHATVVEMVPDVKIEETIAAIVGDSTCVVTAIPDESKGERLVAFHTSKSMSPETLWCRLCESNLPKLWIPKRENLHYLDAIPLLGTGKGDLKRVRALALEMAGGVSMPQAKEAT